MYRYMPRPCWRVLFCVVWVSADRVNLTPGTLGSGHNVHTEGSLLNTSLLNTSLLGTRWCP